MPHADAVEGRDYTGAVYGSLLAASVVVGAGTGSLGSRPRLELVLLLLGTGLVFWATHVFARLFGSRVRYVSVSAGRIRRACVSEWPIVTAAVPPAVAVAVTPLLGIGPRGALWLALGAALAGQVGWSTVAAVRAGASRRAVVVTGAVNLTLGLLIVLLKAAVTH
ncbi:hypothetical protein ACH4L5_29440 [Streptomyces sp. NPDC017405]|uniref:hypothetical protein n=1 Tax=unclassified Streptomyces TaxID=2593676 RepID=UPI003793D89C